MESGHSRTIWIVQPATKPILLEHTIRTVAQIPEVQAVKERRNRVTLAVPQQDHSWSETTVRASMVRSERRTIINNAVVVDGGGARLTVAASSLESLEYEERPVAN